MLLIQAQVAVADHQEAHGIRGRGGPVRAQKPQLVLYHLRLVRDLLDGVNLVTPALDVADENEPPRLLHRAWEGGGEDAVGRALGRRLSHPLAVPPPEGNLQGHEVLLVNGLA